MQILPGFVIQSQHSVPLPAAAARHLLMVFVVILVPGLISGDIIEVNRNFKNQNFYPVKT